MGYSCSARASYTLKAIENFSEFDIYSKEYKYFIEIGKENSDGAITGTVYELLGEPFKDGQGYTRTSCKKKGTFRIEPNGSVARFPGLSKRLWGIAEIASIEQYDRDYSIPYQRYNFTTV